MTDLSFRRVNRLFKSAPVRKPQDVPDEELVRMLFVLGMPADQHFTEYKLTIPRQYLMLRNLALGLYQDYRDAQRGDKGARERIAVIRDMWHEMNMKRARQLEEEKEQSHGT